jgi:hypothetical protein
MGKTPLVTEITGDFEFDDFDLLSDDSLSDDLDAASFADDIKEFDSALSTSRGGPRYADGWEDFSQPRPATTWGGAKVGKGTGFGKSTGYRSYYGGWGSKGYSNYGTYARTSYSSWYSGYNSTAMAMRGVHRSASGFVRDSGLKSLAIYPSSNESLDFEREERSNRRNGLPTGERGLHVRIDASLYEQLGIDKAQQHYTLDAIAQVLALQGLPNPDSVRDLQNLKDFPFPRLVREVITEVIRRRGLELLVSERPGWRDRATAFKEAMLMQPGEQPAGGGQAEQLHRFHLLMHTAWLPNVPHPSPLFPEALELIGTIETFLEDPKAGRHLQLARDITSFVANSSGIGALATTIEAMVEILDLEYERIQPLMPEPPVSNTSRDALIAGFSALRKGINDYFQVDSPDDTLFPGDNEWTSTSGLPPSVNLMKTFRRAQRVRLIADRAAVGAYRGIGHQQPEIFRDIDALTEQLATQRDGQGALDRHCDRIRSDYEAALRNNHFLDNTSYAPAELFKANNLSIVWAHASAKPSFMDLTLRPDIETKLSPAATAEALTLRDSLQEQRQAYRKQTTELLKIAQEADATEGRLSQLIEELPEKGHEVHLRFASGGLADARVRLADLLNDLRKEESSGGGDERFAPPRPGAGEGEGGEGGDVDDLKVDDSSEPEAGGKPGRSPGKLTHNHKDLIVDADVCSEELPHIGTDEDPAVSPDIYIFDATDPTITTEVFS